jgi:hypothetical protein
MLPRVERECEECQETYLVARHERKRRYCGHSCAAKANWAKRDIDFTGANNPRYNGGLSRMSDGRWVICCRDGTIMLFYRGVMAAHLGRLLTPAELVHHHNEDPTDDRLENLQIMSRADHARHHHSKKEAA